MKLRYYLRGLGLGILVTAFLMGAALGGEKEALSDEEIKERAARLGMVESLILAEIGNTQEAPASGSGSPDGDLEPSGSKTLSDSAKQSESVPDNKVSSSEENKPESAEPSKGRPSQESTQSSNDQSSSGSVNPTEAGQTTDSGNVITITIKRGDSSVSVSKALAAAGLVEDANEYDRYLCAGGYDKRICVGVYEIPAGASGEDIAGIITKKSR